MRRFFITTFSFIYLANIYAQKNPTTLEILTSEDVTELFTDTLLKKFNLHFPIFRVYKYSDKSGKYYCVLTESREIITGDKDTFNHNIKAVNIKVETDSFNKVWEINDNIIVNSNEESSIWFWTKYTDFKDYDNDSLVEPIIVYGTFGINGYDDGRIKFLIFYNGKKIAIRHQNGDLDFQRATLVDKSFYNLPQPLQAAIKQKMEKMMENDHAVFPAGWQKAMENKKTKISE